MINRLLQFLERDSDITYYDEWSYIFMTMKELVEVIKTRNK